MKYSLKKPCVNLHEFLNCKITHYFHICAIIIQLMHKIYKIVPFHNQKTKKREQKKGKAEAFPFLNSESFDFELLSCRSFFSCSRSSNRSFSCYRSSSFFLSSCRTTRTRSFLNSFFFQHVFVVVNQFDNTHFCVIT